MSSIFGSHSETVISLTFRVSDLNCWFLDSKRLLYNIYKTTQHFKHNLLLVPCTCFEHFPTLEILAQNKGILISCTSVCSQFSRRVCPPPPPRYPLPSMESSVCDIMINGRGVKKLPLQQIEDSKWSLSNQGSYHPN